MRLFDPLVRADEGNLPDWSFGKYLLEVLGIFQDLTRKQELLQARRDLRSTLDHVLDRRGAKGFRRPGEPVRDGTGAVQIKNIQVPKSDTKRFDGISPWAPWIRFVEWAIWPEV